MTEEPEFIEADVDRERRIRHIIESCIKPDSKVGPEYPLLNVRDSDGC